MLRSVFRGKPIGSLRPWSSADYGLKKYGALRAFWMGVCPGGAFGASRLAPFQLRWRCAGHLGRYCAPRLWLVAAVLWDRGRFLYRLNVNVLLMGWWVVGCYRWTAYPSYGLSSVLDERKRALVVV